MITRTWCLELVLGTLGWEPFEPIMTCRLKYLTWKTMFLLTMTSGRRASVLHTLCCKPNNLPLLVVILFMRLGFRPKVATKVTNSAMRSMCLQCTTTQIWHFANTVAIWSSTSKFNMATERMTSLCQKGSRVTWLARWLSRMLTWLVPTLRPSVQLLLGNPPARLPSTISSTPSPTPMLSLAGEF